MGTRTTRLATVTLRRSLACVVAFAGVAGAARADELQDLRAQAESLPPQNDVLTQGIDEIGRQQSGPSPRTDGTATVQGTAAPAQTAPAQAASAQAAPQAASPGLLGALFGRTPGSGPQPNGQTAAGGASTATEAGAATAAPAVQLIGGTAPIPTANALTYLGITLYGTVDLGVSYQTHARR